MFVPFVRWQHTVPNSPSTPPKRVIRLSLSVDGQLYVVTMLRAVDKILCWQWKFFFSVKLWYMRGHFQFNKLNECGLQGHALRKPCYKLDGKATPGRPKKNTKHHSQATAVKHQPLFMLCPLVLCPLTPGRDRFRLRGGESVAQPWGRTRVSNHSRTPATRHSRAAQSRT